MRNDFSKILETIPPSGIRRFFDLVLGGKDIISLGVGEPDFSTPWAITSEAISALEKGYTSYTSNKGMEECREQVTEYLQRVFNCSYKPDDVVLTNGVSEGVDIVLRTLLNPGDEVLLPEPCYVCYDPLIRLAGGKVISIDTSKSGFILSPEDVEKNITAKTKVLLICSPNNPTGMVIPKANLEEIARIAEKHDLWVISDEIYAELTYDEKYTSFAVLPGMKERTILMNGFSKAFAMTGWRLGYLAGPEAVISRALKIHQYSALCAPIMSQFAAIEALRNSEKHIRDMRESYNIRRNFLIKKLNEIGLKTIMPQGAFYCFPYVKDWGFSSEEFAMKLVEESKVAVVPGSVFGKGGEGYVRCCYATSLDQLKEAVKRIELFLKKKGKK
ncbi:aminotransferase class I/II-fold pyridoxal phosphate-dependent enzyme [Candidatus Margulisiibacteriota bacterium]